ncbi:MAG TPA: tetratricopeptide repeat protein, partial [Kofleriaceae bacterium]|nr:tetratricopeptide repeat protein [Kofleriaceae bacterium]
MRIEDLQAAARELPQHQPSEAQRSALRASLVEAARAERPDAPRRRVRTGAALAIGGALAAAAAAAVLWTWTRSGEDEVRRGTAAGGEVGARRATIQSSSGAHFEHTRVHGPPAGEAPGVIDEVVRLRQGRVAVAVEHLARGERFRVVTGDAEVEVRGTSFDVVVERDELVEVVVHTGLVEVRPEGREAIALHPGERWRADEHPVRTAALEPAAAEPAPAPIVAPAPEPTAEPQPVPVPEPTAEPSSTRREAPAPSGAWMEHRGPGLKRDTRPDTVPEPKPLPIPDAPDEGEASPSSDDPAAATQQELPRPAARPAPTASEVAFARGFRALRRGDYGEATEQFEAAIASGPGSALVDDARYWRAVALARSGRTAVARESLGEFLRLHPRSPRAGEASVM